jgi:hypothetical protein
VGTSKSYGGPMDRTPLLPSWAFPDENVGSDPFPASPDLPLQEQPNGEQPSPEPTSEPNADPLSQPIETPQPKPGESWRSAKISLGKAISGGGGKEDFAKAGRKYVGALGGSRSASRTSRTGKSSTARLGQFLSSVGRIGLNETLERFGLSSFIGKEPEVVFTAISNALAPSGSSREDAISRDASNDALESWYERVISANGDLAALDRMDGQDIAKAIELSVSSYIYHRWLGQLEIIIEEKSMSDKEAVRLERDMKAYIFECVQLDMSNIDVLNMDWEGVAGQQFIDKIYTEAYEILEDS